MFASGALAVLISVVISAVQTPVPRVHDEFSYLLAADTFASGRWANPTHPMWKHFESMHVFHHPTYASKYPPAQGLILAAGILLGGDPLVGVWLATGFAAAACCWMLLAWVPHRWAAIGGVLFALHPGIQLVWGQSYWGGAIAFAGGALVLGSYQRILIRPRVRDAVVMAAGAAVLANSRPYEGCVLCLLVAIATLVHWTRHGWPSLSVLVMRLVLPQAIVLAAVGTWMLHYNRVVTGHAFRLPYQIHEQAYALSPNFIWQQATPDRDYRHEVIGRFHREWALAWYHRQATLLGAVQLKSQMTWDAALFFLPLPAAIPLVFVPGWRGRRRLRFVAVVVFATWAASMITIWSWHHYLAPMAPLIVLLVVQGLRNARVFGRQTLGTRRLVGALVTGQCLVFVAAAIGHVRTPDTGWHQHRAEILAALRAEPGQHLVLVRYQPDHLTLHEWVYNRADIDAAKVVWARDMGPADNAELLEYFQHRHLWLLEADRADARLQPLDNPNQPAT